MQTAPPVTDGSEAFAWTVPFSPASVPAVRGAVVDLLAAHDVTGIAMDVAEIVVSEFLANAITHARALPGDLVEIVLRLDAAGIRVAVRDGGSATLPQFTRPPALSCSGRGLEIVHALTREWGVREGGLSNTVFAVIDR